MPSRNQLRYVAVNELVNELVENITSPVWWLTTVILALLISIAGNYLTRLLDSRYADFSSRLARRREKREEKVEELTRVLSDPHKQLMLVAVEARCRYTHGWSLLIAILCLIASGVVLESDAEDQMLLGLVAEGAFRIGLGFRGRIPDDVRGPDPSRVTRVIRG